ncbi:MAG: poly-gamma-glutamate biosynthesis protein PgsC [Candidatus Eisenbacteria bacterium]|nr:poly-gamma-glutamate biosynthesis protein PgsC [Candidatus Eisenbacteria bacterium]
MIPDPNTLLPAIGLGLLVSLLFSEKLGLTASGLVVPGYIAVYFNQPMMVILTLAVGVLTMLLIRGLGRVMLLYGRRTLVLSVISGYLIGQAFWALRSTLGNVDIPASPVVGYIVGGLIGYWMVRQGIIETTGTVVASSFVVRLVLVLANGIGLIRSSML